MISRIIALVFLSIMLSGCFGIFIAGAAVGGLVVYEGRNHQQKSMDHQITSSIKKKVNSDKELSDRSRIVVSSYDRVVLITGQTPTQAYHDKVIKIAKSTPNVKRIYDELAVAGPISTLTQSSDTWITTKVKSELLAAKGLHSSQITVITEDGVVYLMGVTTPEQGKIAINVARKVDGVQKVVTLFEYQSS